MTHIFRGEFLRGTSREDLASTVTTFRAEVDDPVAALDHFEVVFDDHERVAGVGEPLEYGQELSDVVEVKPRGRFIKDVEGVSGWATAKLTGEFDALGFAAGERGTGLSKLHVVETDVADTGQHPMDFRMSLEEIDRLFDGEIKHVGDVASAITHFERLSVVATAFAGLALHKDIGEEVHLDPADALALT